MKGVPGKWGLLALLIACTPVLAAALGMTEAQNFLLRATSELDDAFASLVGTTWPASAAPPTTDDVKVYYHRARPMDALTANSGLALQTSEALKVPIEFDVAFTSDGEAYVSHGDDVTSGLLSDHTEREYLRGVSSGRFVARQKLTAAIE